MKIIYSLMFLLLFVSYSFAQSNSDLQVKINKDTIPAVKEPIPSTFGLKGVGYFATGATEDIGNGGGVGISYKYNFNKYFGFGVQGHYTYTKFDGSLQGLNVSTESHMIDTRYLLTLQRETGYYKKGLVPWLDLGVSINVGAFKAHASNDFISQSGSVAGVGVGFVIGAGLKYNFEKFYLGASFDYNLSYNTIYGSNLLVDTSGLRVNGELGWRL